MSSTMNIQDKYRCYKCKSAADIYGRSCKHGLLFPVLLFMSNMDKCPNYEFDVRKVEESIKEK
jgi:hypothetical protein